MAHFCIPIVFVASILLNRITGYGQHSSSAARGQHVSQWSSVLLCETATLLKELQLAAKKHSTFSSQRQMPTWAPTSVKASSGKWPPLLLMRSRGVAFWRSTRRQGPWGSCPERASTLLSRTWVPVWHCCLSECITRHAHLQCRAWQPSRRLSQMFSRMWRESVWRMPSVRPPHAFTAQLRVNGWFLWVSASV